MLFFYLFHNSSISGKTLWRPIFGDFPVKRCVHYYSILMHNKHSSFPLYNLLLLSCEVFHSGLSIVLEDQHMEWKPAGQPEHASLNQCQLIVANRCSGHPQQVVEIRFLCNVIDAGALIGPCSHVTSCCCLIC